MCRDLAQPAVKARYSSLCRNCPMCTSSSGSSSVPRARKAGASQGFQPQFEISHHNLPRQAEGDSVSRWPQSRPHQDVVRWQLGIHGRWQAEQKYAGPLCGLLSVLSVLPGARYYVHVRSNAVPGEKEWDRGVASVAIGDVFLDQVRFPLLATGLGGSRQMVRAVVMGMHRVAFASSREMRAAM